MASAGVDVYETVDVTFHNVPYLLTVSTINGDTLCVEAEQQSDASRWRGDFTSRYIEDITSKTGNFKRFGVFVKMLLTALKQESEQVFVELLTYQDLEVLKNRKANGASAGAAVGGGRSIAPSNKRYLILTYAGEFDRVHYPLPLLYDENPDPERLKSTISRLRLEVEQLQAGQASGRHARSGGGGGGGDAAIVAEVRRLRDENASLKQQLRAVEQTGSGSGRDVAREMKAVRKERDLLQLRADAAESELEKERGMHRRELRRRAKEAQEGEDELAKARDTVRHLMARVRDLQEELGAAAPRGTSNLDRARPPYGSSARASAYGRNASRRLPPISARPESRSREPSAYSREPASRPDRSRPNSAPARGGRFDPTEYVRKKQERQLSARSGGSSRAPTPPHSTGGHSGRSSPAAPGSRPTSRPTSTERGRTYSPYDSRSGSRPGSRPASSERPPRGPASRPTSSTERLPRAPSNGRGGPAGPSGRDRGQEAERSYGGRPSWGQGSSPGNTRRPAWGDDAGGGGGWSKYPNRSGRASDGDRSVGERSAGGGQPSERAQSPGRALQEVKRKLSEFVQKNRTPGADDASSTGGGSTAPAGPMAAPALSTTSSKSGLFDERSAEIADIDGRLHALQNFLKLAKSSSSAIS